MGPDILSDRQGDRLWAYLSVAMPTEGSLCLREQRTIVDDIAKRSCRTIERYIIESGGRRNPKGQSHRLQDLVAEVYFGRLSVTLVVADASVLARRKSARTSIIAALHAAGIILKDTTGELHPSVLTVAAVGPAGPMLSRHPRSMRRPEGRMHD